MSPPRPYSHFTRKWFDYYLKWNFKKHFSGFYLKNPPQFENLKGPFLMVSNHLSWWDGFFFFEIQRRLLPQAKIYTVALEKTCIENPILTKMGVLPLKPESPGSLRALLRTLEQLRDQVPASDLALVFFPAGRIQPSFQFPIQFKKGVKAIAKALGPVTVLPSSIHIEPMTQKKPAALFSFGAPFRCEEGLDIGFLEKEVQAALEATHFSLKLNGEQVDPSFQLWKW